MTNLSMPNSMTRPTRGQCVTGLIKRCLDVVGAAVCLALFAPLLVMATLIILVADGRPVIYTQWRTGRDGWLFRVYKLRTMRRVDHLPNVSCAQPDDERVLPCCRWMRKSHIDELPQLLNVLRGQMSLIGPRPERPELVVEIRKALPSFMHRLAVLPGITGLAQLRNGYTNDLPGHRRKLMYDRIYIQRFSLITDLALLVGTLPKFWDNHAC